MVTYEIIIFLNLENVLLLSLFYLQDFVVFIINIFLLISIILLIIINTHSIIYILLVLDFIILIHFPQIIQLLTL